MFVTDEGHMAVEPVEIQQRDDAWNDVHHILRLEADIDDSRRWQRAALKDEFAEIAVTGDEHARILDSIGQNLPIIGIGRDVDRSYDVVTFRSQRPGDPAADIGVADQLQAARARPAAI
jgi:hypothetical protein